MSKFRFEAFPGFFVQDDQPSAIPENFNALTDSFGLKDRTASRWTNFQKEVERLQREAPEGVLYKIFYMSRHGQGWHNLATRYYGKEAWNSKFCQLDGADGMTWGPDAKLTAEGEDQARGMNAAWKRELAEGMPPPTSLYCSPMSRAAQTCELQIHDVFLDKGLRPMVCENFREHYGEHSCDKRSSKTYISTRFPFLDFEPGFAEEDPWWKPDEKETFEHHMGRTAHFLEQVFAHDKATFVGLWGHHGNSDTAFKLIGHEHYPLKAGEMVPFIVKATRL